MLGDHDDFHRDYSNPLPRTDQRTSPIAATCGHADCAESPELARACTLAERFAMPDPDGISWAGERAYRAIMAVFTQFDVMRHRPMVRVFGLPALRWCNQLVLYVNYSGLLYNGMIADHGGPIYLSDFFRGGTDVPRAQHGAMRDALEAENCYCVDRGSCAEIYTLR